MHSSEASAKPYRILVAAGDEEERKSYERFIHEAKDMELVSSTGNGNEVPDLVLKLVPDAVLLDMKLYGMDGLGCLEYINCLQPGKKPAVLFISDTADESFTARVFEMGASFFVLKPCDLSQIEERLRQFCLTGISRDRPLDIKEQGALLARYTVTRGAKNRGSIGRCLTVASWMLKNIGFSLHMPGFAFILEAVRCYLESG
ncbi:MAG TPA: hypothetical protein DD727_00795, partial [Clostridiales bacterium]|nr:hypothetical protein [Clostridiales bacterium]